jgi:predicted nucleic acid-binding protein
VKRALDTNVLVTAHLPAMPDHPVVSEFVRNQIADPDIVVVVTPSVLHEFVHVVTDARRFDPPVPMDRAILIARTYLEHANTECTTIDADTVALAFELLQRHRLGRKRIADTLIAASLLRAGVAEIVTYDVGDFAIIEGLRAIDPRASPARREIV